MKKLSSALIVSILVRIAYAGDDITIIPDVDLSIDDATRTEVTVVHLEENQTIGQALIYQQAIPVQDIYGDGSRIAVPLRGFGDNAGTNTLVVVNGIPIRKPDLSLPSLASINGGIVDSIEVSEQSQGVLFGDQAVGGVLHIHSDPFQNDKNLFDVSYGSFQSQAISQFYAKHHDSAPSYYVSSQYYQTDNQRDNNRDRIGHLATGVQGNIGNMILTVNGQLEEQKMLFPGPVDSLGNPSQTPLDKPDFNVQKTQHIDSHIDWFVNERWQVEQVLAVSQMQGSGQLSTDFNEKNHYYYFNQSTQTAFKLGKWSIFPLIGIDYQDGLYHFQNESYDAKNKQQVYSLYTQAVVPLNETLNLTTGFRYSQAHSQLNTSFNQQSTHNNATSRELGLTWHPQKKHEVYLRYGESFRFPKPEENAFTKDNQALESQHGYSYESGYQFKDHVYLMSLNVYHLRIHDEIFFIPVNESSLNASNRNIEQTTRNGYTVSVNRQISDDWQSGAVYRFVSAHISDGEFNGHLIPYVPRHSLSLQNTYTFNYNWAISNHISFFSSRYPVGDFTNHLNEVAGFSISDLLIRYKSKHWLGTLNIENLFDTAYYSNVVTTNALSDNNTYFYPALGRKIMLNVAYQF